MPPVVIGKFFPSRVFIVLISVLVFCVFHCVSVEFTFIFVSSFWGSAPRPHWGLPSPEPLTLPFIKFLTTPLTSNQ